MGEEKIESLEQEKLCIFDNIQTIDSLSDGKIPEDLVDRLEYTHSSIEDGTSVEIYTDKKTDHELFKKYKLFKDQGFFRASVAIRTEVGRYEMNHYYREFGCTAEEYLFNGIEIDKEEFFKILREQKEPILE